MPRKGRSFGYDKGLSCNDQIWGQKGCYDPSGRDLILIIKTIIVTIFVVFERIILIAQPIII